MMKTKGKKRKDMGISEKPRGKYRQAQQPCVRRISLTERLDRK